MRIVELCTSSGWGGLELYALDISKKLQLQGHECLMVMKPGSMIAKRLDSEGLKKQFLSPKFKPLPLLAARKLASILDQHACDILHVHWNNDLILAVLAKTLSRCKPKLVFIRHMALTRHKRDFYHRFIYQNIDAYLVITRRLQQEAEKFLPLDKGKIHLLYHGVGDFEQADTGYCKKFLTENSLSAERFRILLPGRIEHGKGQHVMTEAVKILAGQGVDVEVAMLGHVMDQSYFDKIQAQLSGWGISDKVHYLGFVDNPVYIYNCFDLLALTTYAETFGLVLIEGMKSGIAVIGTNAGGVPEIIEHGKTGMLFEPGDAQGLANAIKKLVTDLGLRESLALAGQKYADEAFSESMHLAGLLKILTSILKDKVYK